MTETDPIDRPGLRGVPLALTPLARKDFVSDADVRWCPGCGDYAVLAAFQALLPSLGIARENTVIISGIGCSSRFPYYVDTYGMHSIHGRAPAIATGLAMTRQDLAVFVVTGDGDALSIGGNHLIHALRRNLNITILLFNNQIYGLTKGQFSPTSAQGTVTKSSPMGSLEVPFNPISLALGAEASFVARAIDSDRSALAEVLAAAANHRGASFVEIYQNCPIFNDGAYDYAKGDHAEESIIRLVDGEPILFAGGTQGVVRDGCTGELKIAQVADVGIDALEVHDSHRDDPSQAFSLSRLANLGVPKRAPVGIFRDVERPVYDDLARQQVEQALLLEGQDPSLEAILRGKQTWTVL